MNGPVGLLPGDRQELEFPENLDQKRRAVCALLSEKEGTFRHSGRVYPSWRYYKGRRLGPFFRLVYREGARSITVYLGSDQSLATEVQQRLDGMQLAYRQSRALQQVHEASRRAWRAQKLELDRELARVGLYRKGNEIRGWRHLGTRQKLSYGKGTEA